MKHRYFSRTIASNIVALTMLLAQTGMGQETKAALLVNTDWLSAHLKDRNLVLLHVGSRQEPGAKTEYDAGHIPGARFISLEDVALPMNPGSPGLMLELPPADELRAKLSSLGISEDSQIVIYTGNAGAFQSATRIVFTLDYIGLGDRTSVLNGGVTAWTGAGHMLTAETPKVTPGKLTAKPTKNIVADAQLVQSIAQHPNQKLVDARAAVFYKGIEPSFQMNGHIPGAINIPFSQIVDNTMKVDRERVAVLFRDAGIKPGDTVVAYCHVGQQATAVIFAARLLGNPIMLYDGSFQDWAMNKRGAVEK